MSDIKGTQFVCDHCGVEDFLSEQDLENQDKPTGWVEMPASLEHPSAYSDLTHYCGQCREEDFNAGG